jgi:uncharacterized coiled-coil DUF342 family protein
MFTRGAVDRLIANRVSREKKIRRLMAKRDELLDEVHMLRGRVDELENVLQH